MFHVNAVSSDKLQGYLSLLNYSIWGNPAFQSNGSPYTAGATTTNPTTAAVNSGNAVQIYEAWLWWKVSDMFSIRSGRQALEYGDGLAFSKNDWLANPYSVDGIVGRFSWDFLDLDVGGGKLADIGTLATSNTDNEVDFYGFYGSFKNLPDFLKKAEVFVLQLNADGFTGGGGVALAPFAPSLNLGSSANLTSYGLHAKGDVSQLDYRLDAVFQSGKQKGVAGGSDTTFNGNMFDVEVGYTFPEFMKGHLFVNYHQDSGQDLTSTTSNSQYQPLFYDGHTYGGLADVFTWGNLTDIRFGLTLTPAEDTWVGVEANLLSRTTDKGPYALQGAAQGNMFAVGATPQSTDKALGTEIDLWAKHNYGHGFSMLANLGYVTLGNYFKNTTGTPPAPGNAYQLVAQAKYNF
jgi:hypothetical protein